MVILLERAVEGGIDSQGAVRGNNGLEAVL
jgi:hypothetical protein